MEALERLMHVGKSLKQLIVGASESFPFITLHQWGLALGNKCMERCAHLPLFQLSW